MRSGALGIYAGIVLLGLVLGAVEIAQRWRHRRRMRAAFAPLAEMLAADLLLQPEPRFSYGGWLKAIDDAVHHPLWKLADEIRAGHPMPLADAMRYEADDAAWWQLWESASPMVRERLWDAVVPFPRIESAPEGVARITDRSKPPTIKRIAEAVERRRREAT